MKHFSIRMMLYYLMGFILWTANVNVDSWQFWAAMIVVGCVDFTSSLESGQYEKSI